MFKSRKVDYELLPSTSSSAENSPPPISTSLPSVFTKSAKKPLRFSFPPKRYLWILAIITVSLLLLLHPSTPFHIKGRTYDQSLITSISPFQGDSNLPPPLSRQAKFDKTLDQKQCLDEFPAFYPQLELNKKIWENRGGIGKAEVDTAEWEADKAWGFARVIIRDGQLYIRTLYPGFQSRIYSLLELLHDSLQSAPRSYLEQLSPVDLVFVSADKNGFAKNWGLTRGKAGAGWRVNERIEDSGSGTWLMPDFGFGAWPEAGIPSFEEFMLNAEKLENRLGWSGKDERGLWRGWADKYPTRKDLLDRTYNKKGSESWNDVGQTTFHNDAGDFKDLMTMDSHCGYKYLYATEGNSYSGRNKYILSCNSVVVSHPLVYTQHFHAALDSNKTSPSQNFVELPGPLFSGLEETMAELWSSDDSRNPKFPLSSFPLAQKIKDSGADRKFLGRNSAKTIADNAARTLRDRYLTPSATNCYIRAALLAYSQTLDQSSWGPEGPVPKPGNGVAADGGRHLSEEEMKNKGVKGDIDYKTWVLSRLNKWPLNP